MYASIDNPDINNDIKTDDNNLFMNIWNTIFNFIFCALIICLHLVLHHIVLRSFVGHNVHGPGKHKAKWPDLAMTSVLQYPGPAKSETLQLQDPACSRGDLARTKYASQFLFAVEFGIKIRPVCWYCPGACDTIPKLMFAGVKLIKIKKWFYRRMNSKFNDTCQI